MTEEELQEGLRAAFEGTFRNALPYSIEVKRQDNLAWDSLHHVVFMINLEKKFGVKFDGITAAKMTSISKILEHLKVKKST